MFKLIIKYAKGHDLEYYLNRDVVDLGRGALNDLSWADSTLSRRHAQISREATGWVLQDLGSRNGVWVEGQRVSRIELKDGMEITIGAVEILVREVTGEVDDDTRELESAVMEAAGIKPEQQPLEARPTGAARLYLIKDKDKAEEYEIDGGPVTVGSAKGNTVRIKGKGIFPHYLRIERRENEFWVVPLVEPTEKLPAEFSAPRPLKQAELLKLGNQSLLYMAEGGTWNAQTGLPEPEAGSAAGENRRLIILAACTVLVFIGLFLLISLKKDKGPTRISKDSKTVEEQIQEPSEMDTALEAADTLPGDSLEAQPSETQPVETEPGTTVPTLPPATEDTSVMEEPPKPPPARKTINDIPPPAPAGAKALDEALSLYRNGNIDQAINRLDGFCSEFEKTSSEPCPNKTEMIVLNNIKKKYLHGVDSLKANNLGVAENDFKMVLELNKNIDPSGRSYYREESADNLVRIFLLNAQKAFDRKDYPEAYSNWNQALALEPDSQTAKEGMYKLSNIAKQIYEEANSLKTINLEKAKEKWSTVMSIVPPSSDLYKKAKSYMDQYR